MFRCSKCSNSPIYQNFDIFDNWTRINCCTLWSWLSVATNDQHILDRAKMKAQSILQHLIFWPIFEKEIQVDIKAVEQEILRLGFPDEGCDMGDADLDRHALRFKVISIITWSCSSMIPKCRSWHLFRLALCGVLTPLVAWRPWQAEEEVPGGSKEIKINANTTGKKTKY